MRKGFIRWSSEIQEELRQDARIASVQATGPYRLQPIFQIDGKGERLSELGLNESFVKECAEFQVSQVQHVMKFELSESCKVDVNLRGRNDSVNYEKVMIPTKTGPVSLHDVASIGMRADPEGMLRIGGRSAAKLAIFPHEHTERRALMQDLVKVCQEVADRHPGEEFEVIFTNL